MLVKHQKKENRLGNGKQEPRRLFTETITKYGRRRGISEKEMKRLTTDHRG